jgi:hypothetical protein
LGVGKFIINWQIIVHYFLHLVFPFVIAWIFFRKDWIKVGLIMMLTIVVDQDHLLANPVFDPERCSIGFHPLHSYLTIVVYFAGLFHKKTRWIAIGLILHMSTDLLDCLWTFKY